jgi:hypothetical protein
MSIPRTIVHRDANRIIFMDPRYKTFAKSKSWGKDTSVLEELVRGMYETKQKDQAETSNVGHRKTRYQSKSVRMKKMDGSVQSPKGDIEDQSAFEMDVLNESNEERREHDVDDVDTYSRLPSLCLSCCPLQ